MIDFKDMIITIAVWVIKDWMSYSKGQVYVKSGSTSLFIASSLFTNNYGKIGEADLHIQQALSVNIIATKFTYSQSGNTDTGISMTMVQERHSYFPINIRFSDIIGTGQDQIPRDSLPKDAQFLDRGGSYIYLENSNLTTFDWKFSNWVGARYGGVIYAGADWVSCKSKL